VHCLEHRELEVGRMIAERPGLAVARVGAVLRRLKCYGCGQAPSAVVLSPRLRDVPLIGPGALG
jgi:hypothetical protein